MAGWKEITLSDYQYTSLGVQTEALEMGGFGIEDVNNVELDEITTPGALADHGKVYTKTDNKLYFQDGAGVEHAMSTPPIPATDVSEPTTWAVNTNWFRSVKFADSAAWMLDDVRSWWFYLEDAEEVYVDVETGNLKIA